MRRALPKRNGDRTRCLAMGESRAVSLFSADEHELQRQLTICNACRYCEGFCAVFPAMTRRMEFGKADMRYLANLCHNCGACLHACQYAAPHEFDVNIPKALARTRLATYTELSWPQPLGALYKRNGVVTALAAAFGLALFLMLTLLAEGTLLRQVEGGDFYQIFPHQTLVIMFGSVFGFSLLAMTVGLVRFWRDISKTTASEMPVVPAALEAAGDVLSLKNLGGGHGRGCNNADDAFTLSRKWFHHLTFYGFMLCVASTSAATLYHYFLGLHAPYPVLSLPVLLGTAGGLGLMAGCSGLLYLNIKRHPDHGDSNQRPMDRGFILLLFLVSLSGLALLAMRETTAMPLLLAVHLGLVMAFFLIMPYSKFSHGLYRAAALLLAARESRS